MQQRLRQLELVGRGAMAEVYRGIIAGERGTSRPVAIKRLRQDLRGEPTAVELFVHEAQIALQVNHPNVVHALELVRDEQGYALVCEWLECASLASMVERSGKLPWPAAVYVGRALCSALTYLHGLRGVDGRARGIIHRDVTPANVLVSRSGEVKLGDFGVAWSTVETPQVRVTAAGTPGFTAPEQAPGSEPDARIDLYGVGATLRAIVAEPPPELGEILDKACAPVPDLRFANAEALANALSDVAERLGAPSESEVVRHWLDACGGVPVRSPSLLDGAVQSVLGGALRYDEVTPVVAPRPQRRRRAVLAATLVAAAAAVVVVASFWRGDESPVPTPPAQAPAASSAPLPEPTTVAAAPVEPHVDAARPTPERKSGIVNLNAVPWASVTIDGQAAGDTPLKDLKLAEGRHVVFLTHPPQQLRRRVTIEVVADKTQTFVVDLRRGGVTVRMQ
ncbi:MAG: serine/threonine protein kinase [Deltaproteobacteria bacterium]|nr:serine/threonine protein kinase [Deltaproteobacteria bacterium]